MELKKVWNGTYREIPFEINNFPLPYSGSGQGWTFYLILREKQMPIEVFNNLWLPPQTSDLMRGRIFYDYNSVSIIENIEWHCGCTFYDKLGGIDGQNRAIKVGCDYQHLWDDGHHYNEHIVETDVKAAIDSLHKLVPDMNHWCYNCGAWGTEGFIGKEESWLCAPCHEKQSAGVARASQA